ncbi:hypothetical protein [Brevundimonas sp. Root1423]|uniref:hypothetical protein n=1 Tax=Brevundimonas sp. Root1423 TaxID=1736462 RepID=UPI00070120D8|nr:hypothetical protein [Brevundimonas sp. Root1423]KQY89816.1 hypothetical protein ASD25_04615 [Brevundimonas sp. Root1423]
MLTILNRHALVDAVLYSVAYAAAASADHFSTLLVQGVGGYETNPVFQTDIGQLASDRAILVMVALLPFMIALVALARHRVGGAASKPGPIVSRLVGSAPSGPLLLPVVFVCVKALAALSNVALFYTGVSASDVGRRILGPVGVNNPEVVHVGVAAAFLAAATATARPVVAVWMRRMSRGSKITSPATAIP